MPATVYRNFDVSFARNGDEYLATAQSPAEEVAGRFAVPFSELEVQNFLLSIASRRGRMRRIDTPDMAAAKQFGGRLFNALFAGEMLGMLRTNLNEADHTDAKLRVRLRLTGTPELADLPWEYLYNPSLNRFLALDDDTAVVRYLDLPERVRPVVVALPLRALVVISDPNDFSQLDVEQEWANLNDALQDLLRDGSIELDLLQDVTLSSLRRRLSENEYHIFHFIGHGGFDKGTEEGTLIFKDSNGRGKQVSGQELGWLLHNHKTLALAVLNACEGARADRTDAFAGTAQSLVQQGIPAVVAMQFEITDDAAKTFAHAFYKGLAAAAPLELALTETRIALYAEGHGLEWATPVLYTRLADGKVFDVKQVSADERKHARYRGLYDQAQQAMGRDEWGMAEEKLKSLLAEDPTYPQAVIAYEKARHERELGDLYLKGLSHYREEHWPEALASFRRLRELAGSYRDVDALLVLVQSKIDDAGKREQVDARPEGQVAIAAATLSPDSTQPLVSESAAVMDAAPAVVERVDGGPPAASQSHNMVTSAPSAPSTPSTPLPPVAEIAADERKDPTSPPVYQASPPVYQAPPPTYQPSPPAYQTTSPVYQAAPPAYPPTPPVYQASPQGYQANPPVYQAPPTAYNVGTPQPQARATSSRSALEIVGYAGFAIGWVFFASAITIEPLNNAYIGFFGLALILLSAVVVALSRGTPSLPVLQTVGRVSVIIGILGVALGLLVSFLDLRYDELDDWLAYAGLALMVLGVIAIALSRIKRR